MSVGAVSSGAIPFTQSVRPSSQTSQAASDFKSLADALQSGDLAGAQKALTALQQDTQAVPVHHHHHHHHQAQAPQQQAAAITPPPVTAAVGSAVNVLA